jgi:hypothetical protein
MVMACRDLDLIGTEEPSRHRAGEAGIYWVVIKAKPNTILQ